MCVCRRERETKILSRVGKEEVWRKLDFTIAEVLCCLVFYSPTSVQF